MDQGMLKCMADMERQQRDSERADKRLVRGLVGGTVIVAIGIAFLTYQGLVRSDADKARFMRQCMEDHKEYECTYLWRSSERPAPDVIPIPIPIPMK